MGLPHQQYPLAGPSMKCTTKTKPGCYFSLPGTHGRGDAEGIGTRTATQSKVQHKPFGKSCSCPWAAAV